MTIFNKHDYIEDMHKEFADAYKSCLYWVARYAQMDVGDGDDENELLSFIVDNLSKMGKAFHSINITAQNQLEEIEKNRISHT